MGFAPLLALDFDDIARMIIPIIFVLVSIYSAVFGNKEKAEAKRRREAPREPQPQPQPRPLQPQQQAPPAPRNEEIANEIEEFLRRASQRRGGQPQPAQQAAPQAPARPQRAEPRTEAPARPQRRTQERQRREAAKREPQQGQRQQQQQQRPRRSVEPTVAPTITPIAPSISPSLPPLEVEEQKGVRAGGIAGNRTGGLADHVHQVFDHQLGTLVSPSAVADGADSSASTPGAIAPIGLAALLANRQNLQTAIVLNEILERPVHRW